MFTRFRVRSIFVIALVAMTLASGGFATQPALAAPPPPVITSFVANPTSIAPGGSSQLAAMFSDGKGSIDHGVGAIKSGSALTVKPAVTTTYTLTVDGHGHNGSVTARATVTVTGTKPVITSFAASPTSITAGGTAQLTAVFSGGTGSIDNSVGAVTSGTAVTVSPTATTTYTLTADNGTGGTATRTATVTVTVAAIAIALTPSVPSPVVGQPVTFTATVTPVGSTGKVGIAVDTTAPFLDTQPIDPTTGAAKLTVTFSSAGQHTVFAYYIDSLGNIGGLSGSAKTYIQVNVASIPGPVISSFVANPTSVAPGGSSQLTAMFSSGTGSINNGVGAVTSGSPVTVKPGTTTTYTLTVDNGVGTTITAQATVTFTTSLPVITSFVANPLSMAVGGTAQLTGVFSGGTGSIDNGVGGIQSGAAVSVKPTTTTTYTLTVDNGVGTTVTKTATVTVTGNVPGTAITLTPSVPSPVVGQPVTFTATVTPQGATGTVKFGIDAATMNPVALDASSQATLTYTFTTAGAHTVYAWYTDAVGNPGVKTFISIQVN